MVRARRKLSGRLFSNRLLPYVPASILQLHNDVILVADEAALSRIS